MSGIQKNSSEDVKKRAIKVFNDLLVQCDNSKVYGKYCEQLYGKDFRQFNQMPHKHLEKALALLRLNSSDSVLDMGCGNGRITEYISKTTGCSICGIDFADKMIEQACTRVANADANANANANAEANGLSDKISFECRDFDNLAEMDKKFTAILAIDGIDLDRAVGQRLESMLGLLKENGQILIMASADRLPIEPEQIIEIENQTLVKLLKQKGIIFNFWDFTEDQRVLWKNSLKILESLKDDFIREGSQSLYEDSLEDTEDMIEALEHDLQKRYMLHVRL